MSAAVGILGAGLSGTALGGGGACLEGTGGADRVGAIAAGLESGTSVNYLNHILC